MYCRVIRGKIVRGSEIRQLVQTVRTNAHELIRIRGARNLIRLLTTRLHVDS